MVRPDDIAGILNREHDPKRAAQLLVDAANEAGGEDNVTAVIIDAVEVTHEDATAAAAVPDDDTADAPPVKPRRRTGRTILRVLVWGFPILAILAIAFGAVAWYARNTYFVGVDKGAVTVFKGRPGGLLGWDPTVEKDTGIETSQLTQSEQDDVESDKTFSSRGDADDYVARLKRGIEARTPATTIPVPPESTVPPLTATPPS
jgi:PPM family protein phosphatase